MVTASTGTNAGISDVSAPTMWREQSGPARTGEAVRVHIKDKTMAQEKPSAPSSWSVSPNQLHVGVSTQEMIGWIVGSVLLSAVLVSPVACTIHKHNVIAEAIKNGADLIAVKCAIDTNSLIEPACIANAMKQSTTLGK